MFAANLMYIVLLAVFFVTDSFSLHFGQIHSRSKNSFSRITSSTRQLMSVDDDTASAVPATPAAATNQKGRVVVIEVPLGDGYNKVKVKFSPIFAKSKFFVSTVDVPFSLNVEKAPEGFPAPVVTKAGKAGEQEGDALRGCTAWSAGFAAAGVTADISMFAGSVKLQKSLFDCTLAPWDAVVTALTSNTVERSQSVTLIFEREIE